MKTLNELYNEVIASEALKAEFLALKAPEEIIAFAKKYGCDATLDEIKEFFEGLQKEAGEMSEAELEQVAGGKNVSAREAGLSCFSLGIACVAATVTSLIKGRVGTAIEGNGMLCALDNDKHCRMER